MALVAKTMEEKCYKVTMIECSTRSLYCELLDLTICQVDI